MLFNLCSLHLGDRSIARRIAKSIAFPPGSGSGHSALPFAPPSGNLFAMQ
jgi:hypothetical protein